jgi:hypothetical protein
MASATLAETLNTPMAELRPTPMQRILVIEADSALQEILRWPFSSEGYDVDVVPDGDEGLEMLGSKVTRRSDSRPIEPWIFGL